MAKSKRPVLIAILLLLVVLLIALLSRCSRRETPVVNLGAKNEMVAATENAEPGAPPLVVQPPAATTERTEKLTPATIEIPQSVVAGAPVSVHWTGPNNPDDYITIVAPDAPPAKYDHYTATSAGSPLEVTAPIQPGRYEVRYIAERSKTVLGRAQLDVTPAGATLDAVDEVLLGSQVSVAWTGPDNEGDYVTIVPANTPDGRHENYAYTAHKSPVSILVPPTAGAAELRYMTGQGNRVLARRPLRIVAPKITLDAPDRAVEGTAVSIQWTGSANRSDYITIVPADAPDGRYANYTQVEKPGQVSVLAPVETGKAEIRFMTGVGNKVLERRAIFISPAEVTLDAPATAAPGEAVTIKWTGPNNSGDYLTIVPQSASDEKYGDYADTHVGNTVTIKAPKEPGIAEIRYVSAQKHKIFGRREIRVVAP
ncbi:MAG TPA: hypothetical protein VFT72_07645 [Opitutaceae bacterium]|nr:hypothetical protein [Opitutaceae bacterium]